MPTVTLIRYGVLLPDGTLEVRPHTSSPLLSYYEDNRGAPEDVARHFAGARVVPVTLTYESEPNA